MMIVASYCPNYCEQNLGTAMEISLFSVQYSIWKKYNNEYGIISNPFQESSRFLKTYIVYSVSGVIQVMTKCRGKIH